MTNDRYEPPEAIRLTDKDAAFGQCHDGSSASKPCGHGNKVVGYRENGFQGVCVTGKSATDGCFAGIGCTTGSAG